MPNARYSPALAAAPVEAILALDAFAEIRDSDVMETERRAEIWRREGVSSSPGLLRTMQASGAALGALAGFEKALDEICERSAAESGRSVQLFHLSGEGVERSLLYLRIVAGFRMAGAEEAIERVKAAARSGAAETVAGISQVFADMRQALEALAREFAMRVDPQRGGPANRPTPAN